MIPANFRGAAKRLDAIDIVEIGKLISVGEDEIRAILEVESRGSGFDKQGRPAMLFEPHVFWRELGPGAKRDRAAKAGLAYPKWKRGAYPRDSYPRLEKAIEIDETAALRSASWGLAQVMGFNHQAAGFSSVRAMVAAFCDDEEAHLEGMIKFIKARGLGDEIRRHDWRGFARAYNGEGYAANRYDQRLAAAYARWVKVPDARFDPAIAAVEDEVAADGGKTFADRARIEAVQKRLLELGYAMTGRADGVFGPRTAGAIAAFQTENGLPVTGEISDDLISQLEEAEPHEPSPERAAGVPDDSAILKRAKEAVILGGTIAGGTALDQADKAIGHAEQAAGLVQRLRAILAPFREMIGEAWPFLAIGAGLFIAWRAIEIYRARVEDHRKGKTA